MNVKTIIILVILAIIIFYSLKSLWKHLKGDSSCGCGSGTCSKKKMSNHLDCSCKK